MKASVSPQVIEALTRRFGAIVPAGAGAWSAAFRFRRHGADLVVRVGPHVSDFEIDKEMSTYSSAALPIPIVHELEALPDPHGDLFLCVSSFAPGQPLESVEAPAWDALVPVVADLLDAMSDVSPPEGTPVPDWPAVLLDRDEDDGRLDGWRPRLEVLPDQLDAHHRLVDRLEELCDLAHVAEVEPTLLHCDLINRNVHVQGTTITGVFDWGCRRWGDHLYDLAWFEFWSPWYPHLDVESLRSEMSRRWGTTPNPERLEACLAHIAADHLVYSAAIDNPDGGREIMQRAQSLNLLG